MLELIKEYQRLAEEGLRIPSDYVPLWKAEMAALNERAKKIVAAATIVSGYSGDPDTKDARAVCANANIDKMPYGTVLYTIRE